MENASAPSGENLHTELSLVDAAAFSVGLIGPVGVIGLLVVCVAPGLAGRVKAGLAAGMAP
jgi:hypothetical protein